MPACSVQPVCLEPRPQAWLPLVRASSSAWPGLHLHHTPWILDTRSCHTRQTRAQHILQDKDSHHAAQSTCLMATRTDGRTDVAEPGDRGAGVHLGVPGCSPPALRTQALCPLSSLLPEPHADTEVRSQEKPDSSFQGRPGHAAWALWAVSELYIDTNCPIGDYSQPDFRNPMGWPPKHTQVKYNK